MGTAKARNSRWAFAVVRRANGAMVWVNKDRYVRPNVAGSVETGSVGGAVNTFCPSATFADGAESVGGTCMRTNGLIGHYVAVDS
jgi:hypothetical protein